MTVDGFRAFMLSLKIMLRQDSHRYATLEQIRAARLHEQRGWRRLKHRWGYTLRINHARISQQSKGTRPVELEAR
jgi:hypothetical protein